jgi:hypothetical protein
MGYDLSTLDLKKIKSLPVLDLPAGYSVQKNPGSGCFLDPPGYPSYFIRAVYNKYGNEPANYDPYCFEVDGVRYGFSLEGKGPEFLESFWLALPPNHPRVHAWFLAVYQHLVHCYENESATGHDKLLIYPVPSYQLKKAKIDPRFKTEINEALTKEAEKSNKELLEHAEKVGIPENHKGYRLIKDFYPNVQPDLELIKDPGVRKPGDWWERYSTKPSHEDCPGDEIGGHRTHPTSNNWCQLCGWKDGE